MNPSRLARRIAAACASLAVLGCSDSSSTVVAPRGAVSKDLLGDLLGGSPPALVSCQPMPYDSVTQVVGPDGGTIRVGAHTLAIPPGALADSIAITAVAPTDSVRRVTFQPEGLQFARPAQLTLSSSNCDLLGSLVPKRIAYVSGTLTFLDLLPSVDDFLQQSVTGQLRHFSDYAIAW